MSASTIWTIGYERAGFNASLAPSRTVGITLAEHSGFTTQHLHMPGPMENDAPGNLFSE
jgi:hypothetical protein